MMAIGRVIFAALLLCAISGLITPVVRAAAASPSMERNLQFSNLTTRDGLSAEYVTTGIQDAYGFVWLGTQNGLNRYDGHDIVVYEHDSRFTDSLSDSFIWKLYVDSEQRLWVTTNRGVNIYDYKTDSFERNPLGLGDTIRNARIRTMVQDSSGVYWLGSVDQGLYAVEPNTGTVRHYLPDPDSRNSLPDRHIIDLLQDSKGRLWVATDGGGLARWERGTGAFVTYRHMPDNPGTLNDDNVRSIYEDHAGRIWVGTERGLNLFDDAVGSFRRFEHDPDDMRSIGAGQVPSIVEDSDGTLWVGTESGLSEWRPDTQGFVHYRSSPDQPESLVNDRVNAMFQDASGVLWLATFGGVSRWNYFSDTFTSYQVEHGLLADNRVTSVAQDEQGVYWIGTYGGGLTRLDLASGDAKHYRRDDADPGSLRDDRVMAVSVDREGRIWVGTRSRGLSVLHPDGEFTHFHHDPDNPSSLSSNAVTSLVESPAGGFWIGTFGGGLNHMPDPQRNEFVRYQYDPEDASTLSSNRVVTLHIDATQALWVGTEAGGLSRLDPEQRSFTRYPVLSGGEGSAVDAGTAWDILETSDGTFWISTMGQGLLRWSAEERVLDIANFERFGKAEGLSSTIYGTLVGDMGEIWASSSAGLYRFDPTTRQVTLFDAHNGLRSADFTQGAQLRSRSGRLLFGGNQGLVGFFPGDIPRNARAPELYVTARSREQVLARTAGDGDTPQVELRYLDPFIAFEFVALDFVSPKQNQYRYRLSGFDEEWIHEQRFRRALYTNLPPGSYTFELQAANNDGVWNQESARIQVSVTPPPWQQWWAYAGYALLALLGLSGIFHRQKSVRRREQEQRANLEQEVTERTRELNRRNRDLQALNAKLADASLTDSLTGLRNRRYVDQYIEQEFAMVRRRIVEGADGATVTGVRDSSKLLFFMMIDLDEFKAINDTYGHQAGDLVLLQVKDILLDCCRESDAVVRWGGDEFMVIGHASRFGAVKVLAERIRDALAEHHYDVGHEGAHGRISGSIGIAPYPVARHLVDSVSWEQVCAMADKAAYLAKSNGRNAWVSLKGTEKLQERDFAYVAHDVQLLVEHEKVALDTSIDKPLHYKPVPGRTGNASGG